MTYDTKEKPELELIKSPLRFKMAEMAIMRQALGQDLGFTGKALHPAGAVASDLRPSCNSW